MFGGIANVHSATQQNQSVDFAKVLKGIKENIVFNSVILTRQMLKIRHNRLISFDCIAKHYFHDDDGGDEVESNITLYFGWDDKLH